MLVDKCTTIMAILQENRSETATKVQDLLTKYGCFIRVRLGLHESAIDACSNTGIILLQLCGEVPLQKFEQELRAIGDAVRVKYMTLDF